MPCAGREVELGSFAIERGDFDEAPFNQHGGLGRMHALFGDDCERMLDELNEALAA